MKKEDILAASRKENKNTDLAEAETNRYAGAIAGSVGALVCGLVSLLASLLANIMLYCPWVIYFSMISSNWLIKAIKQKRKSDWLLAGIFMLLCVLAFIGFLNRLSEVSQ